MKSFKQFVKEETMPYAGTKSGIIDIRDSTVRDGLNQQLAGVTACKFLTPYLAFERICKALANFHIFPPRNNYFEGDSGSFNFPISQFGAKIGMTDDGQVVGNPDLPHHLYFEYRQADSGMFMIFCEIVDQDELDEILQDLESELSDNDADESRNNKLDLDEERHPALPEVGPRKTSGSNEPLIIMTNVSEPSLLKGSNRDKMKSKLETKSIKDNETEDLGEDNVPYIPDPESTSTADYKPASKIAEENINEVSKKMVSRYLEKNRKETEDSSMPSSKFLKRMGGRMMALKKAYPNPTEVLDSRKAKVPATGKDYKSTKSVQAAVRRADKKKV